MCKMINKLQIPIEVSKYVQANKMAKAFGLFVYLKFKCSGKFHADSTLLNDACKALDIKSLKTLKKYLGQLTAINWMGYNAVSGYYFVRGFDFIRFKHGFKNRQATTLCYNKIKEVPAFITGSILSSVVKGKQYYWEVAVKRKMKTATNNGDVARQSSCHKQQPKYYGVSLPQMMSVFNCGKTRASQLRTEAAKKGFIKVNHKFEEIMLLRESDYNLRSQLYLSDKTLFGKVRFKKKTVEGVKYVQVLVQTYDEVIPNIPFKTLAKFNQVRRVVQLTKVNGYKVAA